MFLGGTGNITGLARKLPVLDGMAGCIRKFVANEHVYEFSMLPHGDVTQGFDVRKYIMSNVCVCVKMCQARRCAKNDVYT